MAGRPLRIISQTVIKVGLDALPEPARQFRRGADVADDDVSEMGLRIEFKEACLQPDECDRDISVDARAWGQAGIAIKSRGDVDGEYGNSRPLPIDPFDQLIEGLPWRTRCAGTEYCIDNERKGSGQNIQAFDRDRLAEDVHRQLHLLADKQVSNCLGRVRAALCRQRIGVKGEQELNRNPFVVKQSRQCEAVTAVVPLAAADQDGRVIHARRRGSGCRTSARAWLFTRSVVNEPERGFQQVMCSVLHEDDSGDAVLLDGCPVECLDLLPAKDVQRSSSRFRCCWS